MNKEKRSFKAQLNEAWDSAVRLRIILFLVLLVSVYGFIGLRIQTLSSAQPDSAQIASKVSETSKPYIDKNVVDEIRELQDNSVNVQALFNQARQNPFRE